MTVAVAAPTEAEPPLSATEQWRRRYRRRRSQRSTAVALASTTLFAVVLAFAITSAPGWSRVRQSFFSWDEARSSFPDIARGMWLNIRILVVSEILILVLALFVAGLRTLRGPVFFPLRALTAAYVDLFRGMPLIIVLFLIGYGLPGLRLQGIPNSPVILGTVALVLTYGAYVAEVFRAGIESVHPSQRAAARSLGLTHGQSMRLVVLPQAVRNVLPPLLNDFVSLQKDVGLISVLGAVDAVRQAQIHQSFDANFTPYVVAGLLFVLLAVPSARLADYVSARYNRRQRAGGIV